MQMFKKLWPKNVSNYQSFRGEGVLPKPWEQAKVCGKKPPSDNLKEQPACASNMLAGAHI